MAVKPSNAALTALRNTRRAKQEELGRAYEAMGGSNTALVSNSQFAPNTIPSLKRAIENRYAEAQSGGRDTYGDLQAMSNAYNDYANANTSDKLKHVKSESYAQLVSQPTIMGMANPMYGNLSDDMKSAGLTLEELERFNKAKSRQTYEDVASQIGAEHPLIATGLAAAEQPLMSLGNVAKNVRNYALGNPIENNFNPATALRQSVAENNIDTKVGNFAYGVGNSMADMLIASLAGANAGPGIMGLEKADQVMNSAVDRGLTPNQIMAEGIGSAITTALTERIPFKEFKAGNNITRAMLSEGLQEGSEDIADTILDEIITRIGGNNEKSEYNLMIQAYRDAGYSEEEAKNAALIDYLKQLGLDSLAGAISGGGMGAVGNISQGYNAFTGRPRTNAETESNVTADAEPETIPSLRDSRAEEQAIQDQRNAELAQLTEAVSQMREQQNTQNIPQVVRANPEDVIYHAGILSRLNKAETNGKSGHGTGYFGTGHYFVDGDTLHEIETSPYIDRPLSSVDISGYNNLFRADTDEKALNLHNFLGKLIDYANFRKGSTMEQLYDEYLTAFNGEDNIIPYEEFERRVNAISDSVRSFVPDSFTQDRRDSASTQFMKSLGYGGVDTRGTRYADTRYGTVIYDLDENSVLQGNVPALQRATTDMLTRSDNRNFFDTEEDAKIQKIIDSQRKTEEVETRAREIFDNSEIEQNKEKISELENNRREVQENIYNLTSMLNDVEGGIREDQRFMRSLGLDVSMSEEEIADKVKERTSDYSETLNRRQADLASIDNQIAELKARNDSLLEEWDKAKDQAREEIDAAQANQVQDENAGLDEDLQNMQTPEEIQGAVVDALKGRRINLQMFSDGDTDVDTEEELGRVETGRHKTSKAFTNTGSKVLTPHERKVLKLDGSMEYEENSEKESMQAATDRLVQNGFENEYQRLLKKEKFNNVDVDEMFKLRRKYVEEALDLEARGQDATDSWKRAKQCFEKLQDQATDIGAGLQAYAKWSRNNTADGLLHQVTQVVNRFHNGERLGVMSRREMKRTDFEKQLEKLDKVKLSDEFVEEFTRIARQIEDMAENGIDTSVDAKAIEPMNKLGQMVDSLLPVSLPSKVRSLLILNMLGNPRTLITRNAGGNIGFNAVEDFIRKPVSYIVDKGVSKLTGKRTVARPTAAIYNAGKEGFIYGLSRSVQDFRQNVHSARSGENNLQTAAVNNRKAFTDPVFGTYERLVNFGLDVGDRMFYEKAYNMAIEEGKQLYKDGAYGDLSEKEFDEMNKLHAMNAGLEAVYQNDTLLSDAFLGFREKIGNLSKALFGVDIISQFAMPFTKTPANIIYNWLEYSPFGIVKNAVQTIREVNAKDINGNKVGWKEGLSQERFSKETARNIVGSALFYIFFNLASKGLFTGGYDDDDRVAQAQREAGMQEYALHTNNGDYDISWLPVLGGNAYSAAAVYDAVKDPNLTTGEAITKGISAGLGSQFSASMLQGLQRLFGASGYQSGTIADNIVDTILSGTSQVVPSLLRQASAVGDQYQRNNYGPNFFDRYINSLRSSIPWLRDDLQPRVSLTGEYRQQNPGENLIEKIWSNMISPATHTVGTPDAVRDEAMRLYESTGNTLAFQPYLNQTDWKSVAGELPDAETLRVYQENAYKAMNQAATQMINSDFYASLTDGEKESTLSQIYSAVNSVERANLLGSDKSNLSGAAKAYDEGGIEGLMNYVTGQRALATLDITNNEDNREAVLNALGNGSDLPSLQSQYQSSVGSANTSLDSLMNNQYRDMLSTLSEESMTELRKNLDNAIKGVEFNTAVGNDKDYQEAQAAYNNGGVNGLAEYLFPAAVLKQYGMTNNEKNREMILNAYNEGGMNTVNRQIQTAQTFSSTAYGENLTYRYDHATNYLPSLTPSQFATLYDTVDQQDKGTSGFNTISQQEVIDYLNQNPGAYDSNTALQYWNAFDQHAGTDDQWKKIPVLVNGQWVAKKA